MTSWSFVFFPMANQYPLVMTNIAMENSTMFHKKTPLFFYGDFPWQTVKLPGGTLLMVSKAVCRRVNVLIS